MTARKLLARAVFGVSFVLILVAGGLGLLYGALTDPRPDPRDLA